jgi:hypothetical protein
VQGSGAYKAKVKFPEDKDVMERTVIVGDMNPLVTLDQVRDRKRGCEDLRV